MEWVFCCCCFLLLLSSSKPTRLYHQSPRLLRNTVLSVIFLLGLLDPLNLEALGLQTGWRCFLPHETSRVGNGAPSPSGLFFCISRRRRYCAAFIYFVHNISGGVSNPRKILKANDLEAGKPIDVIPTYRVHKQERRDQVTLGCRSFVFPARILPTVLSKELAAAARYLLMPEWHWSS